MALKQYTSNENCRINVDIEKHSKVPIKKRNDRKNIVYCSYKFLTCTTQNFRVFNSELKAAMKRTFIDNRPEDNSFTANVKEIEGSSQISRRFSTSIKIYY